MGLPGSGKTTLASELVPMLNAKWINNDKVREEANDWDFSEQGRSRQAKRMADLAEKHKQEGSFVVCDFLFEICIRNFPQTNAVQIQKYSFE